MWTDPKAECISDYAGTVFKRDKKQALVTWACGLSSIGLTGASSIIPKYMHDYESAQTV